MEVKSGYTHLVKQVGNKERSIATMNIVSKNVRKVNGKTLLATVDFGKFNNVGYCRCPDGTEVKPFEFLNNGRGFKKFWSRASALKKKYDLGEIIIGFEPTGCYTEPFVHYFRNKRAKLVMVNSSHTHKLKEICGNSPNKTDHKDSKVIADIVELGHTLSLVVPEGAVAELRRLTNAREKEMVRRVALLNQLGDLMFRIFPEFGKIMNGFKTKSAMLLIEKYSLPEDIASLGVCELTKILKKVSRGQLGKERAEALYEASLESVGIKEGLNGIHLDIERTLFLLKSSENFIEEIESEMSRYLAEIPYSRYILSIKGVGLIIAAGVIGEVGDFYKFSTIAELHKLAGLDLYEISSGTHRGKRRISKRGRSLLRKFLYFGSLNMVRKGGIMHDDYHRYLDNGMKKTQALIAVARRLLGIILALVRDENEYRADYCKNKSKEANYSLKKAA